MNEPEKKQWNPAAVQAQAALSSFREGSDVQDTARAKSAPRREISLDDFAGTKRDVDESKDYLYVPKEIIPDGIVVEWKRWAIFNKPDRKHAADIQRGGWKPIPSDAAGFGDHFSSFINGDLIENEGLVLCYRPKTMSDAARVEEARKAGSLVQDKMAEMGMTSEHKDIPGKRFKLERGFEERVPGGNPDAVSVPE